MQFDRDTLRRAPVIGVEHVRRQASVHLQPFGRADMLIEPQGGDPADFGQGRLKFG